jgi:hypothetical protein
MENKMDLPIDLNQLRDIVIALEKDRQFDLAAKLKLVARLMEEDKPYKKILREEYNIVA